MAQEVEHVLGKDEVTSSNLVISSRKKHSQQRGVLFSSAVFHLPQKHPYNKGRFFWGGRESCGKKHVQKLGLKLSSVGLVLKNPCPSECFFVKFYVCR